MDPMRAQRGDGRTKTGSSDRKQGVFSVKNLRTICRLRLAAAYSCA
jgi:hypothetical protein